MKAGRQVAERRGRRAETIAALWLGLKGWRVVARRRRLPMIEVDLVVRRGALVAVVEVKRRASIEEAVAALTPMAAARLQAAAGQIAAELSSAGAPVFARVDLVALAPGRLPRHIAGVV
jgi:putative endonuclease